MKFDLYGYSCSNSKALLNLNEVTFCIDSTQALQLSIFFAECAKEMKEGSGWEHKHFSGGDVPDVIVFDSSKQVL